MPEPGYILKFQDSKVTHFRSQLAGISVDEADFFRALERDWNPSSGLLPPCIRWVSAQRKTWLLERPPTMMRISHHNVLPSVIEDAEEHVFIISIPWMAYLIELDDNYYPNRIFAYALRGPLSSEKDMIGILPLANFYASGMLCQPPRHQVHEVPQNSADGISLAYRMVWESGFNADLGGAFVRARTLKLPSVLFEPTPSPRKFLSLLSRWQTLSLEDVSNTIWPYPAPIIRDEVGEDLVAVRAQANQVGPRLVRHLLYLAQEWEIERRGEWDSMTLMRSFQAALSQAALEKTD